MRMLSIACIIVSAVLFSGCDYMFGTSDIPLVKLISDPSAYNGHLVRVIGYLTTGYENDHLYMYKEDARQNLWKNCVSIEAIYINKIKSSELIKLSGQYVIVEGRYNAWPSGRLSACVGNISDIRRLEVWKTSSNVSESSRLQVAK